MSPDALILRIRVARGGETVIGPGRADLLMHIAATGSIAAAGRQMRMSYKRAWALVEAMNTTFATPLVDAVKGGAGGGGAKLTAGGRAVLAAYRELERDATAAADAAFETMQAALAVPRHDKTG